MIFVKCWLTSCVEQSSHTDFNNHTAMDIFIEFLIIFHIGDWFKVIGLL